MKARGTAAAAYPRMIRARSHVLALSVCFGIEIRGSERLVKEQGFGVYGSGFKVSGSVVGSRFISIATLLSSFTNLGCRVLGFGFRISGTWDRMRR